MIAHIFPTIDGIPSQKAKNSMPYFELRTTDTPYTVPSHGLTSTYYATPTMGGGVFSGSSVWSSTAPIVKFYSGRYWPDEVTDHYENNREFGVKYSGKYYTESSSVTFNFSGNGYYYFSFDSSSKADNVMIKSIAGTANIFSHTVSGLTPDTFYDIEIKYRSFEKGTENCSFVVTHNYSDLPHAIPLAAGNCISDADFSNYSGFIPSKQLTKINNVSCTYKKNEGSKLTFSVPVVSSTASFGYQYNSGDYYVDAQDLTKKIQKFRMITFFEGYKVGSTISTVTKFTGQIRNWDVTRDTTGKAELKVECYDWTSFLLDTLNLGYPNEVDYLQFEYTNRANFGVAGDTKPRTYDAWRVVYAIEDLLSNAYIDPKLYIGKKKFLNIDNDIAENYYLVSDNNADTNISLDRNFNYGRPYSTKGDSEDDSYLWQFGIGEYILDNIQAIADNYGWTFGFNNEGKFYLKSYKTPIKLKTTSDIDFTGIWGDYVDITMVEGLSKATGQSNNVAIATFTGVSAAVIVGVGNGFGNINIKVSNPTLGEVYNTTHSTDYDTIRYYFSGADNTGSNPCIIDLQTTFKYGTYSLNITTTELKPVIVNSIFVYNELSSSPAASIYSGDIQENPGVIVDNLKATTDSMNFRNDVTVIGKLLGEASVLTLGEEEEIEQPINPNNPVNLHVVSRAVDRSSLGDVSSDNYIGRKIQTIIVEPSIGDSQRANWLARETILRYNNQSKMIKPDFDILGNPLFEVDDTVLIRDIHTNTVNPNTIYYVDGIIDTYSLNGKFTTSLELNSTAPWESFYLYPTPSLSLFGNTVFQEISTNNTGLPIYNSDERSALFSIDPDLDKVYLQYQVNKPVVGNLMSRVPDKGYLKINDELIKYGTATIDTYWSDVPSYIGGYLNTGAYVIKFSDLSRGMFNTATISFSEWYNNKDDISFRYVDARMSPYSTEDFNIYPNIQFRLLKSGFVRIYIRDTKNGEIVYVFTGRGRDKFENKYDYLEAGKVHTYQWGMIDEIGSFNESNTGFFYNSGDVEDYPRQGPEFNSNFDDDMGDWKSQQGSDYAPYKVRKGFYIQNFSRRMKSSFELYADYIDTQNIYPYMNLPQQPVIYSSLKMTSNKYGLWTNADGDVQYSPVAGLGVREQVEISARSSLDPTDLNSSWLFKGVNLPPDSWGYNERFDAYYLGKQQSSSTSTIIAILENGSKYWYTGMENSGKGLKINIRNFFDVDRICTLSARIRGFAVLVSNYDVWFMPSTPGGGLFGSWVSEFKITAVDPYEKEIIEGSGSSYRIGKNSIGIYIPFQGISFITPIINSKMNEMRTLTINGKVIRVKEHYVSHLHFIEIIATDFSGRTSVFGRSIFWIHPQYVDYDKRAIPSPYPPYLSLDAYFHRSEYFPPHLRANYLGDKMDTRILAGVLVYE